MSKAMLAMFAIPLTVILVVLLTLAWSAPTPVSDAEFCALVGTPYDEVVKRLGPPDRDLGGWASWENKVTGPAGRVWERAQLKRDPKTGLVAASAVSGQP